MNLLIVWLYEVDTQYVADTDMDNGNVRAQISTNKAGPSCPKLTTSLVNDSLKFTSSDTQIC